MLSAEFAYVLSVKQLTVRQIVKPLECQEKTEADDILFFIIFQRKKGLIYRVMSLNKNSDH